MPAAYTRALECIDVTSHQKKAWLPFQPSHLAECEELWRKKNYCLRSSQLRSDVSSPLLSSPLVSNTWTVFLVWNRGSDDVVLDGWWFVFDVVLFLFLFLLSFARYFPRPPKGRVEETRSSRFSLVRVSILTEIQSKIFRTPTNT